MSSYENHKNYNSKITLDSGEEYFVYVNWLHNNDLDHWKGWSCDAGVTHFFVNKNYDIWDGMCKNAYLGNILKEWSPLTHNVCMLETCTGCTADLSSRKSKNVEK